MKYFSVNWLTNPEISNAESAAVRDAYWAEIEAIKTKLPPAVLQLATKIELHDGLVRYFELNRIANRLTIALRCGDLQVGYFDIDLTYLDIDFVALDLVLLKDIATDPKTELLYDEVGLASAGRFVHRIIFSPIREIEVVFGELHVEVHPKSDKKLGADSRQFRECENAA